MEGEYMKCTSGETYPGSKRSFEPDPASKSFVSFYDYNRTTCGWMRYMFGLEINVYRRLMWVAVFFTGFCYSVRLTIR